MQTTQKLLDMTDGIRTIRSGRREDVDASVKRLLSELGRAEQARWAADRKVRAIHTALQILGVKPQAFGADWHGDSNEVRYVSKEPFKNLGLAETCERILRDYKGQWITRAQVEYLATRGGYDFSTTNPQNSVDVTLRRLAKAGKCDAERVRGSRGNKYRWIDENSQDKSRRSLEKLAKID